MFRIGVDIGGTFTDFAIWRRESAGYVEIGGHKVPTSRPRISEAVTAGIAELVARYEVEANEPVLVVHGTTVSTNAIIERSEPPIALLVTSGYRDILGLARLRLDKPIDLFNKRPAPIVPRERVFEIEERLLADGGVDTPLDEASVVAAIERARARGASAIGICFLHAHRNPAHEKQALEIARARFPDLEIMASHEVWPQQSEYERAVVTLLNVYVKRMMDDYIGEIDAFLREKLPQAKLYITKSNGGIMSSAEARRLPIHTLLSGPAAGVTAARALGRQLGVERILTLDMGGTSTDVSLVDRGRVMVTGQAEVGDFPLLMPVTAIEAMGAGGGSLVWLDGGVLKVGPRSAGSVPGPACYGQGGRNPTLTDAYLIAGYLSPKGLLGGRLPLELALAERAFAHVAAELETDIAVAAASAIQVATSNMLVKVLPFLARQGVGPSDLNLLIFGGAGGIHGPILAEEIGIRRIIVPRIPSVFCAYGCLVSDLVHDGIRTVRGAALTAELVASAYAELRREGDAWLGLQSFKDQVVEKESVSLADMRYAAQSFTIPVDITSALTAPDPADEIVRLFHDEHLRLFGHANPGSLVAVDELRLRTIGRQAKPAARALQGNGAAAPAPILRKQIRLGDRTLDGVPVHAWNVLPPGWSADGPAIIEQDLATILVPPSYRACMGRFGDLELSGT
jgi:N-methylhydantoinase A